MYGIISKPISGTLNQSLFLKKLIVSKKYGNSLFPVYDSLGETFLTRLRLNFIHLKQHNFRHGFVKTVNPMCACGADV